MQFLHKSLLSFIAKKRTEANYLNDKRNDRKCILVRQVVLAECEWRQIRRLIENA